MNAGGICVIGDALIDELRWPDKTEEFVGGAALNVAVGLARLGIETSLVAMVGSDAPGDRIRTYLDEHGVSLAATSVPVSSRAVSDRLHGEPTYVFNDAALSRHIGFDAEQQRVIDTSRFVVVTCFPFDDQRQTQLLSSAIHDSRSRLLLDPNPRAHLISDLARFRASFETLAARSYLVKIGEEDAQLLYQEPLEIAARHVLQLGPSAVLATGGAKGATLLTQAGLDVYRPIFPLPAPIVDTMGAGDATLAQFAASLDAEGLPTTTAHATAMLGRAMEVAAATCRRPGALLQLPSLN